MENLSFTTMAVIAIVVILIVVVFLFLRQKDAKTSGVDCPIDLNELFSALGNVDNLVDITSTMSKVTFVLKDYKSVDVDKIKTLGATGIVENKSGLNVIFGKVSPNIAQAIRENYLNK